MILQAIKFIVTHYWLEGIRWLTYGAAIFGAWSEAGFEVAWAFLVIMMVHELDRFTANTKELRRAAFGANNQLQGLTATLKEANALLSAFQPSKKTGKRH